MVLGTGLEPARLAAHAPQTCVSTSSTTRAVEKEERGIRDIAIGLSSPENRLPQFGAQGLGNGPDLAAKRQLQRALTSTSSRMCSSFPRSRQSLRAPSFPLHHF